jgi:hypothetical protein
VLDADAKRCIGVDGRSHDGVIEHLAVEELKGLLHGQVVAGTASHQRH